MKSIGAFEAKTHLSQLLDEVVHGKEFAITKHGKPIARLIPYTEHHDTLTVAEVFKELDLLSKKIGKTGMTLSDIKKMKEAGRA